MSRPLRRSIRQVCVESSHRSPLAGVELLIPAKLSWPEPPTERSAAPAKAPPLLYWTSPLEPPGEPPPPEAAIVTEPWPLVMVMLAPAVSVAGCHFESAD